LTDLYNNITKPFAGYPRSAAQQHPTAGTATVHHNKIYCDSYTVLKAVDKFLSYFMYFLTKKKHGAAVSTLCRWTVVSVV